MKILLIYRRFDKERGGIPNYLVELARQLVKQHQVHLLTADYEYKIPGLIIHKKTLIKTPFWVQILSNAYFNTEHSRTIKQEYGIDIVFSTGAESFQCDVWRAPSCHKASIKKHNEIFKEEEPFSKYLFYKFARWIWPVNKVVLFIEKRVIEKGSKKIITLSKGGKQEIIENYKVPEEKITIIPNGIDLENFKPDSKTREEIRKKYDISEKEYLLMFCAHNFRGKGLKFLIEALPKLSKPTKLLVIGRGYQKPYINLASILGVRDKIIFKGAVKEHIEKYYQASDIFILPTYYENFPNVVLEALASGLPVLATKVNGIEDILEEGKNGFFIERDGKNIAQKINKLLENDDSREKMSKNARETGEGYSWGKITQETIEVFQQVLK